MLDRRQGAACAALLGAALTAARHWLTLVTVTGRSMEPTLRASTRVLLLRTSRIRVGDVVVARIPERKLLLIKRVTALALDHDPGGVPPGHVYLEGDNPAESWDSRQLGPVPRTQVLGRVVWPSLRSPASRR